MSENYSQDKHEKYEEQFNHRNRRLQETIKALAQYPEAELDEHGKQTEIAKEHGVDRGRVGYVLRNWRHLVKWRRFKERAPVSPDAADAVPDDENLKALADGVGEFTITWEVSLTDAFRAMQMLPSDMSTDVYIQTLSQAEDIPRDELRRSIE